MSFFARAADVAHACGRCRKKAVCRSVQNDVWKHHCENFPQRHVASVTWPATFCRFFRNHLYLLQKFSLPVQHSSFLPLPSPLLCPVTPCQTPCQAPCTAPREHTRKSPVQHSTTQHNHAGEGTALSLLADARSFFPMLPGLPWSRLPGSAL